MTLLASSLRLSYLGYHTYLDQKSSVNKLPFSRSDFSGFNWVLLLFLTGNGESNPGLESSGISFEDSSLTWLWTDQQYMTITRLLFSQFTQKPLTWISDFRFHVSNLCNSYLVIRQFIPSLRHFVLPYITPYKVLKCVLSIDALY